MQLKNLLGIGIDSISWNRAKRFLDQHSGPDIARLLTPSELKIFKRAAKPLDFFARCFTAKEAYFKAKEGRWMGEEGFRQIEVIVEENHFRIVSEFESEGEYFETPEGLGARIFLWKQ